MDEEINCWRTSVHPEDNSDGTTLSISIEMLQDTLMKNYQMKGCGPTMNDIDLQDWIDVYENEIKDLDIDKIIKDADIKFFEVTNQLYTLKICY